MLTRPSYRLPFFLAAPVLFALGGAPVRAQVACGDTLRALMERDLVRVAGRAEEPGSPLLYGTTPRFLAEFGLRGLKDLPTAKDLPPPPGTKTAGA